MAKDAYYFSHDANAKDDPKCVMLIEQLGLEGFGIYWVLIEVLRDQPTYKYPLALIPAIARRYNTTAEKMKIVISGYGLFEVDDNDFFSLSLIKRMGKVNEMRNKRIEAGKKSGEIRALSSKTPIEEKDELPQMYVLRCYKNKEEFIKVGYTTTSISRRFSGKMPYEYEVLRQIFSVNALEIEIELQNIIEKHRYQPAINFAGNMECFNMEVLNTVMEFQPKSDYSHEHRSSNVQQRKEKKGKEIKLKDTKECVDDFTTNVDLLIAIRSFIEMRKSIKAPMTDNAVKLMLNKLNKLSNDDAVKIEILNQSVMSSWKDIYELKQQKLFGNQQQTRREEYPEI